jgi:hypothetical protein
MKTCNVSLNMNRFDVELLVADASKLRHDRCDFLEPHVMSCHLSALS